MFSLAEMTHSAEKTTRHNSIKAQVCLTGTLYCDAALPWGQSSRKEHTKLD